jgi:hypothetical protein
MSVPVILDVDTGVDDALAILGAFGPVERGRKLRCDAAPGQLLTPLR